MRVTAQMSETNAATISAGLVRGIPGTTVGVPISMAHTGVVSAIQFDLNFPAAKMSASLFQAAAVSENVVLRSRQIEPGRYRVLVYGKALSLLETNAGVGVLPFTLPAGDLSGGGHVRITNALASGVSATAIQPVQLLHGAVLVGPVFRGSDGVVDLFLNVQSNRTYLIQATTDFTSWVNLATNFATLEYVVFKDIQAASYAMRFYRAVPVGSGEGGEIESVALHAGGFITFAYPSIPGNAYIIQASTNLSHWDDLGTNVAGGLSLTFTNLLDPAYRERFFRVVERP
jgi:hypothetical protein